MTSLNRIIWIGSYPKSGNTWVRAFLGNYIAPTGQKLSINELSNITTSDIRGDWFDLAAGGHYKGTSAEDSIKFRTKVLRMIAGSQSGHRFVKTHFKIGRAGNVDLIPSEVTAAAICIIRNPFDVVVSYARHSNVTIDVAIDRMCDPSCANAGVKNIIEILGRWDDHITGWTKVPGLPRHIMRYEDMIDNPKKAFRSLLGFLNIPVQPKKLRTALEETSFKALQRQEKKEGFREKPPEMETFFTSGKYGGWKNILTPTQVDRMYKEFKTTVDEYFPEVAKEAKAFIENID